MGNAAGPVGGGDEEDFPLPWNGSLPSQTPYNRIPHQVRRSQESDYRTITSVCRFLMDRLE